METLVDTVRNAICANLDPFTSTVKMAEAAIAAMHTFYSEKACLARMAAAIGEQRQPNTYWENGQAFDADMAKAAFAAMQIPPK